MTPTRQLLDTMELQTQHEEANINPYYYEPIEEIELLMTKELGIDLQEVTICSLV